MIKALIAFCIAISLETGLLYGQLGPGTPGGGTPGGGTPGGGTPGGGTPGGGTPGGGTPGGGTGSGGGSSSNAYLAANNGYARMMLRMAVPIDSRLIGVISSSGGGGGSTGGGGTPGGGGGTTGGGGGTTGGGGGTTGGGNTKKTGAPQTGYVVISTRVHTPTARQALPRSITYGFSGAQMIVNQTNGTWAVSTTAPVTSQTVPLILYNPRIPTNNFTSPWITP